jgi:hypothetical protein
MSLGFKKAKVIGDNVSGSKRSESLNASDPLFEKEWDELVIRFDKKSSQFRVRTASQPADRRSRRATAKLID